MAGSVIVDKLQADSSSQLEIMNGVALIPPTIEDVNGVQVGTFCRAWVSFNGTGAGAPFIRGSFNISSITDNGVGDYSLNFTNAMPDINYSYSHTYSNEINQGHTVGFFSGISINSLRIIHYSTTNSAATADKTYVGVAIFR